MACIIRTGFIDTYVAPVFAAILLPGIDLEGKLSKKELGLYEAVNQLCQLVKIWDLMSCVSVITMSHCYIIAYI